MKAERPGNSLQFSSVLFFFITLIVQIVFASRTFGLTGMRVRKSGSEELMTNQIV